jgi:hypothetical protein
MASISYEGSVFPATEIIWFKNQPSADRDSGKWVFTWRGWCKRYEALDLIPPDGTSMTAAPTNWDEGVEGDPEYKLKKARISGTESPDRVEVELTYEQDPVSEYERSCYIADYDVTKYRLYDAGAPWQDIATGMKDKETYNVGILKYEASKEFDIGVEEGEWEWTEEGLAERMGLVASVEGELGTPSGLDGEGFTSWKWRFAGKEVRDSGEGKVTILEKWDYCPIGWGAEPPPTPEPEP